MSSRRVFLKAAGAYALALPLGFVRGTPSENRPNMILIIGDDISVGDHGVYGHPTIRTPNIDRLAAGGLRFNNVYLTAPSCSPTRCSLITGRYPHNTGAPELHMPLPEGQVMFPSLLRQNGYYTAAAGKWHLGSFARAAFDHIRDSQPSGAELWVETLRRRPADKPFFMWFAAHDAHRDWQSDPDGRPHEPQDAVVPPYQADTPETRRDIAKYMDEVQRLDRYIGDVMAELRRQNILENTLVLYMADNGRPFPRDKAWLYDSGIKTPLIVHWPKGLKGTGMISESLVSVIDIAPTLLEAAGVNCPETVQGVSFSALFGDPSAVVRQYAFAEMNWHTQYYHVRAVRWKHYVYLRNTAPELSGLMMAKVDRGYAPWMDLLRLQEAGRLTPAQANVMRRPRPEEELYDVQADPHQLTDLAQQAEHQEALAHLRAVIAQWTAQTGDTVPDSEQRTPDRYCRQTGRPVAEVPFNPVRRDWPGKALKAETINDRGPVRAWR